MRQSLSEADSLSNTRYLLPVIKEPVLLKINKLETNNPLERFGPPKTKRNNDDLKQFWNHVKPLASLEFQPLHIKQVKIKRPEN